MIFNLNTIDHDIIVAANNRPDYLVINVTNAGLTYNYNDNIDASTITVTCVYTAGNSAQVNDWVLLTPKAISNEVSVQYTYNGQTVVGTFNITVRRVLDHITATTSRSSYPYESTIDPTTISVTSYYTDGTQDHPTNFTFSPTVAQGANASASSTTVTVSYTENGTTKTASFNISFTKVLDHITCTNSKTTYNYGDTIDASKITVTAYYTGGGFASETVSGWSLIQTTATGTGTGTQNNQEITITYTFEGVTVQTTTIIQVSKVLDHIISTSSTQRYAYNAAINKNAITTTAYYTDGTTSSIPSSSITISPTNAKVTSDVNATSATVTVTYSGKTSTFVIGIYQVPSSLTPTLETTIYTYNQRIQVTSCSVSYTNGSSKTVQNFTYSPSQATATTVNFSYTENGTTVSTSVIIKIVLTQSMYSGVANFRNEGNGNWYAELLTSGDFTIPFDLNADIYLLGGGQGGDNGSISSDASNHNKTFGYGGAGGQGGGTYKQANVTLAAGVYACNIGAGGAGGSHAKGGDTTLGLKNQPALYTAKGGGNTITENSYAKDGAAGGTAGQYVGSYATPTGGGNGANATVIDYLNYNRGGGGGGGSSYYDWAWANHYSSSTGGAVGSMGGGKYNKSGTVNYGGGGGGGSTTGAGSGGSGVIIIRNKR